MQKNDIVEIKITGMTDEGSGVGRCENIAIFVPYALLGETVKVHIIKVNKSYCIGKLIEVITPSENRVKADCEYFYRCGGCSYRNVSYEEELAYKFNIFTDMTEELVFSLSDEFKAALADVNTPVQIHFCHEPDYLQANTLTKYVYQTALQIAEEFDWVTVDAYDSNKEPTLFAKYSLTAAAGTVSTSSVIIESGDEFRIMSAGRFYIDNYHRRFYAGYNFSMYHFAGSKLIRNCVNDQLMLDPYVGTRFNAFLDFDIKLHYIQTFQRDRDNDEKYLRPKGGMLQVRMSKWGIYLDEQLYMGENLQPYYRSYRSEEFPNGYGGELYGGESFYSTTENIYNITKIGYDRTFFSNTVRVNCYFAMQYDGTGWGNKQIISVSVRLLKDVALSKK